MARSIHALLMTLALAWVPSVLAQSSDGDAALDALRDRLSVSLGVATQNQLQIVAVTRTAMANLVQVELDTGEILYTSEDGSFVLAGDLYSADSNGLVNLSAQQRQSKNMDRIAAIPESEMVIFSPPEKKASITVFTDVDCTFCRKLHSEIDQLLAFGIEVRYLAYPRGGENAASFQKMINVWCSPDRPKALTQAKNDQNLPQLDCVNPVMEHYALGNAIGISGTPALIFPDGVVVPGYIEAPRLAAMLGISP